MKLHQIQQFVTLSETLNFHHASDLLNIAQPALSVSIRKLEEELGAKLFSRDNNRVSLTAAGTAALEEARKTLFHAHQFKSVVKESQTGERGRLRLGFVGSVTPHLLPKLVRLCRANFPNVELALEESWTIDLLEKLDQELIDLALVRVPVKDGLGAKIDVIEEGSFVAAVPLNSPLAGRTEIELSELRRFPFIIYSKNKVPNLRSIVMLMCHQAGFEPVIAQETIQNQTMISLVESGLGVALVSAASASPGVRFLRIVGAGANIEIGFGVAWRPERRNLLAQNFVALANLAAHEKLA